MYNILVIEDNDADANLIKAYLKESNFKHRLFYSSSLTKGIEIIEDDDSDIDIVLLDLSLDDSSGYATLTSYLAKVDHIPVVVLTGNKNQIVGVQSVSAGAQDFLVKGEFNSQRLVNCIKYAIQRFKKQKKLKDLFDSLQKDNIREAETSAIGRHGTWQMDIVNKTMWWSKSLFHILDIPSYTMTPSKAEYLNVVHVEDRMKVEDFFERASQSQDVIRIEHRILLKNKQVKTLELSARVKFEKPSKKLMLLGYVADISFKKDSISLGVGDTPNDYIIEKQKVILNKTNELLNIVKKLEGKTIHSDQNEFVSDMHNTLVGIKDLIGSISEEQRSSEVFSIGRLINEIRDIFTLQLKNSSNQLTFTKKTEEQFQKNIQGNYSNIANLIYATIQICIAGVNPDSDIQISAKVQSNELNRLNIVFNWEGNAELFRLAQDIYTQKHDSKNTPVTSHRIDLSNMLNCLDKAKALIQIDSKSAVQNSLSLSIPIEAPQDNTHSASDAGKRIINLLLIEDHVMRRISLKKKLQSISNDIVVDVVESGSKALEYLEGNQPDIVLMDTNLPDNESLLTTERIIQDFHIPIIGLTSHFSSEEEKKWLSAGMSAYLENKQPAKSMFEEVERVIG